LRKAPRLKEWRDRRALSQDELAELSGVSRGTIANLELDRRISQPRTIRKLAQALSVEPADLYGEDKAPSGGAPRLTREQFAEHGVTDISPIEMATVNRLLEVYVEIADTGASKGTLTIPESVEGPTSVDLERVYLLIDYAIMVGILTPRDIKVLSEGLRARLASTA
jgi:transcriptional regulator with XRE-family HTH domain